MQDALLECSFVLEGLLQLSVGCLDIMQGVGRRVLYLVQGYALLVNYLIEVLIHLVHEPE